MPRLSWLKSFLDKAGELSTRIVPGRLRLRLGVNGRRAALHNLGNVIGELGRSSEGEFLAMGEKVQDFHQRTNEIAELSSHVTALMSGLGTGEVIEDFSSLADRIKKLEVTSAETSEALRHVFEQLGRMRSNLLQFNKLAKTLHVLCVFTRIESARFGHGDDGFKSLADDVGKLAADIELRCTQLLDQSDTLVELVRGTLSKVLELRNRQHNQGGIVLDNTLSSLGALTRSQQASIDGTEQIAACYRAISQNIGEVVASMQFHDIARQRMEHVEQALDSAVLSSPDHAMLADVCRLQAAQLNNTGHELVAAVNRIVENLQGVAQHIAMLSEQTMKLVGAADETDASSLSEVEAGFATIAGAFADYACSNRDIFSAIAPVGETLAEMSVHANDIESIGIRIRLIALNAIIKACQMGEEGAALSVVADAIHQLSLEAHRQTATVNEDLRSLTTSAQTLSTMMDQQNGRCHREVTQIGETLDHLKSSLRSVNTDVLAVLKQMDSKGRSLSEDIHKATDEIAVIDRVSEVIDSAVSQLEQTADSLRRLSPRTGRSAVAGHLQSLAKDYTMERERVVHRTMVTGPALTAASLSTQQPQRQEWLTASSATQTDEVCRNDTTEEDLGDNVELF